MSLRRPKELVLSSDEPPDVFRRVESSEVKEASPNQNFLGGLSAIEEVEHSPNQRR